MVSSHQTLELHTERLILREWSSEDLEPFARMNADPLVMRFMPSVLTRAESDAIAARIRDHFAKYGFGFYAVELTESGMFAGFTGLAVPAFEARFTPCVEIGWRIRSDLHNRGYATEAARAVLAHGFNRLGLTEIVSFTVPQNQPSRRVMEKLGMVGDGEFDHPRLPAGHPLQRHVLYRITSGQFSSRTSACASVPEPASED